MLQGQVLDVKLRRMARDEMADHVQMFELFTLVKEVAIGEDNPEGVAFVDELISLWTKMLLDDAVRDDTITANVRSMQDASIQQISVLQEGFCIGEVNFALECSAGHYECIANVNSTLLEIHQVNSSLSFVLVV
jgi:hypothetical protein